MSRLAFVACALVFASIAYGQTFSASTRTCANITMRPVPDPFDFPGYPDCVLGSEGCSKWFDDPIESAFILPGETEALGAPESDATTGWITWNTQRFFAMFETVRTFNGTDNWSTQVNAAPRIRICVDLARVESACDSTAVCGAAGADYFFWIRPTNGALYSNTTVGGTEWLSFQYIDFTTSVPGLCPSTSPSVSTLAALDADLYTPNGATCESGCGRTSNALFPLWSNADTAYLRYSTFVSIPLNLIGNATFDDILKVNVYLDNGRGPGDDVAPSSIVPDSLVGQMTPGRGAQFILECDEDVICNNDGVCDAGIENCLNCPGDCFGNWDPEDPYFGPTVKAKSKTPYRLYKSKSKNSYTSKSKSSNTTSSAMTSYPKRKGNPVTPTTAKPTMTSYPKRKGNPSKSKYGKGKGPGKTGSKNKNFGKGKYNPVCCGFANGFGDGCGLPECNSRFAPSKRPTTPAGAGKGKYNGSYGMSGMGPAGKGMGYKSGSTKTTTRAPTGTATTRPGTTTRPKSKGKHVSGDFQCINATPYCGDGICSVRRGENCTTCARDCGSYSKGTYKAKSMKAMGGSSPKSTMSPSATTTASSTTTSSGMSGKYSGKGKVIPGVCCGGSGPLATCAGCPSSVICSEA